MELQYKVTDNSMKTFRRTKEDLPITISWLTIFIISNMFPGGTSFTLFASIYIGEADTAARQAITSTQNT